jgi:bacteriochlorophyll 4-vinyl reductase
MNEAGVGRILPASLHQGIADLLPSRLDFYEAWLNPKAMRDGRIGPAPIAAVLSFLRREGDAYPRVSARAGEYAAEWTFGELSAARRSLIRAAPLWLRLRLVAQVMRRMTVRTARDCRATVRWKRRAGTLGLSGSIFCAVRERAHEPLCDFYAAALRRLMALAGIEVDVTAEQCHATGAERCQMTLTVRAS